MNRLDQIETCTNADDPYRAGQTVENGRPICGAKKRDGNPCGASPARGATRCARHGGNTPQARNKAKQRRTNDRAARQLRALGYDPDAPNVDPAEALLNLVSHKYREVGWWREYISHLHDNNGENADLIWGVIKTEQGVGPMGPVDTTTTGPTLHVAVQALHKAEDQLARYSKSAMDAGVQQREIALKETVALELVGTINAILSGLNLTAAQRDLVPVVVPQALRTLEEKKTT
mgnify:CR=1 FL=1